METKNNQILDLSFEFAIEIVQFCEYLDELKKYSISNQLIWSGTSIGANIFESQHAESKSDFIHKMKIASKEAAETYYWLKICEALDNYSEIHELLEKLITIQKLLSTIISRAKANL